MNKINRLVWNERYNYAMDWLWRKHKVNEEHFDTCHMPTNLFYDPCEQVGGLGLERKR